jgi:hypothetical protein
VSFINDMMAGLQAVVAAGWPDITEVAINEELEAIPWDLVKPPYAAIICSDPVMSQDSATAAVVFSMPVRLAYMGPVGMLAQWAALWDKPALMVEYLQANALPYGQLMSIDGIAWSGSIETNRIFSAKNYAHRLVVLDITVQFGYQGGFP